MEAGTSAPIEEGGYPGTTMAGAAFATLFFPVLSLVLALLLMGGQTSPQKRGQLRMWAWVSGGWLVLQVVLVIALFSVASHSSGSGPTHSDIASITTSTP
jgi:fumarate reductase subunit D